MNIVLIGASGLVGSELLQKLLKDGFNGREKIYSVKS